MYIEKLINTIKYVNNFEKEKFDGGKPYLIYTKDFIISELCTYLNHYIFFKHFVKDNTIHNKDLYIKECTTLFDNIELSEMGIINFFLKIIEQDFYPRNVHILSYIFYKPIYNIQKYQLKKFIKSKRFKYWKG